MRELLRFACRRRKRGKSERFSCHLMRAVRKFKVREDLGHLVATPASCFESGLVGFDALQKKVDV